MKSALAAVLVALTGFAAAASKDDDEQPPALPAGEQPAAPAPDETAEDEAPDAAEDAAEVFVPSEAISEDIAVPFPVDI